MCLQSTPQQSSNSHHFPSDPAMASISLRDAKDTPGPRLSPLYSRGSSLHAVSFLLSTLYSLWDLSSWTRDRTHALGSDSLESQPLDCQGIPSFLK